MFSFLLPPAKSALLKFAFSKLQPRRFAALKFAPWKLQSSRLAPLSFAPSKFAFTPPLFFNENCYDGKYLSSKLAPLRLARSKLAPPRFAPRRLNFQRICKHDFTYKIGDLLLPNWYPMSKSNYIYGNL